MVNLYQGTVNIKEIVGYDTNRKPKGKANFTPNVWTFVWEGVTPNVPKGH